MIALKIEKHINFYEIITYIHKSFFENVFIEIDKIFSVGDHNRPNTSYA